MNNWTVRTRIIGAFAAVITIMIGLSAISYSGLRTIRGQATPVTTVPVVACLRRYAYCATP